ncbi:MAG: BatA domain-containing protein [Vicinamibacterales bacterium]
MIWLNPWAWLGLAAVAVPVLVHLLARRTVTRLRFPTLRFIAVARLLPARRRRLSDVPLLLVRVATIVVAAAALAGPLLLTPGRRAAAEAARSVAILVDASPSMTRADASGAAPIDRARDAAARAAAAAAMSRTTEVAAPDLDAAVRGAGAWLADRGGLREVILISDFQAGSLSAGAADALPTGIGLTLVPIHRTAPSTVDLPDLHRGADTVARHVSDAAVGRAVDWIVTAGAATSPGAVVIRAAEADGARAAALLAAVRAMTAVPSPMGDAAPSPAAARRIVIVLPGAPDRDALAGTAAAVDQPWMSDAIARMAMATARVAGDAPMATGPADEASGAMTIVARDGAGAPLAEAGAVTVDGAPALAVFTRTPADAMTTAALVAGAIDAVAPGVPASEFEPASIPRETLEAWQRAPRPAPPRADGPDGPSDARWLWAVALVLLAIEGWMRRRGGIDDASAALDVAGTDDGTEVTRGRVA